MCSKEVVREMRKSADDDDDGQGPELFVQSTGSSSIRDEVHPFGGKCKLKNNGGEGGNKQAGPTTRQETGRTN